MYLLYYWQTNGFLIFSEKIGMTDSQKRIHNACSAILKTIASFLFWKFIIRDHFQLSKQLASSQEKQFEREKIIDFTLILFVMYIYTTYVHVDCGYERIIHELTRHVCMVNLKWYRMTCASVIMIVSNDLLACTKGTKGWSCYEFGAALGKII